MKTGKREDGKTGEEQSSANGGSAGIPACIAFTLRQDGRAPEYDFLDDERTGEGENGRGVKLRKWWDRHPCLSCRASTPDPPENMIF